MVSWNGGGGVNVASQVGCGARCRFVGVVWKDSSFESPKSPEVLWFADDRCFKMALKVNVECDRRTSDRALVATTFTLTFVTKSSTPFASSLRVAGFDFTLGPYFQRSDFPSLDFLQT